MTRYRALLASVFLCSLLRGLIIVGCGGGGGEPPPPPPATVAGGGMVTLQGRVDDGTPHSPIANAPCRFVNLRGFNVDKALADGNGVFQFMVPVDTQGFIGCSPPGLPNLGLSAFASTTGRAAGETIANLMVSPATTLVADILVSTKPPNLQVRADELTKALAAGDADLTLLAQAITTLYNAQLANTIDVAFTGGGTSSEDSGASAPSGQSAADDGTSSSGDRGEGGAGGGDGGEGGGGSAPLPEGILLRGQVGDGGAFSPLIPNAVCDFALELDGPTLTKATLGDFLATGTVNRTDLQDIAAQVNAAFAGQQDALAAAFRRQFPNGFGRPFSTTADQKGVYVLNTPSDMPGFVRCHPSEAANLVLARFVQAYPQPNPFRLPEIEAQDVTPATTVAAMVVTDVLQAELDPVPIQNAFLANIAPLRIILPDRPNGNGMFATVQLTPGATLSNPKVALLAFAATTIFDTMRLQRANIPTTVTFVDAVQDYFQDATFMLALAPLTTTVNTALDQSQAVIGLGRNDIAQAASSLLP